MREQRSFDAESPAVQKHLEMIQGIITRMADNSRSCKLWCITLVAAALILLSRTETADHVLLALAPTTLLYLLDAYYLSLENAFRQSYRELVRKIQQGPLERSDIYSIAPGEPIGRGTVWAMTCSLSVPPFYITVIATILLTWHFF